MSWVRWVLLAAYAVCTLLVRLHHEPWLDEAQAWLLARDAGPVALLRTYGAYEGSPVLWHLLLCLPAQLGWPYEASMGALSVGCSVLGAWLLLRFCPLPLPLIGLILSSYYVAYQYPVVARSYCLLLPLLSGLAIAYQERVARPGRYVALLAVLSWVSAHGFVLAGGLFAEWCWRTGQRREALPVRARYSVAGAALWLLSALLVCVSVRPPADVSTPHGGGWDVAVGRLLEAVDGSLGDFLPLSVVALGCLIGWWWRSPERLAAVLTVGPVLAFLCLVYASAWHFGILVLIYVFLAWITWETTGWERWGRRLGAAVVVLCLLRQSESAWRSMRLDWTEPYSGSGAAAQFLRDQGWDHGPIYLQGIHGTALQPYFDRNPFLNFNAGQPLSFWAWNSRNRTNDQLPHAAERGIETVVVAYTPGDLIDPDVVVTRQIMQQLPYREVKRFTGHLLVKGRRGVRQEICIYRRVAGPGTQVSAARQF